jgi:FtsZ-binding cell division protein ZapB
MLDQLRAFVRSLQAFREDFENELRSRIDKRRNETEEELVQTRLRSQGLASEVQHLKEAHDSLCAERDAALRDREKLESETRRIMDAMQEDQRRLLSLIREQETEMDQLHQALDRRDQILRHKEMKLMRITQLESEISRNRARHQFDLNQLRAQNMKVVKTHDREMSAASKIDAEKRSLEEKLYRAEMQLTAFKNDVNRTRAAELEKKLEKAEALVKTRDTELQQLRDDGARSRQRILELEKRVVSMKLEYDKMYLSMERDRARVGGSSTRRLAGTMHSESASPPANTQRLVNGDNSEAVEFYRKKLMERDREIADLSRRVKKLLALEQNQGGGTNAYGQKSPGTFLTARSHADEDGVESEYASSSALDDFSIPDASEALSSRKSAAVNATPSKR